MQIGAKWRCVLLHRRHAVELLCARGHARYANGRKGESGGGGGVRVGATRRAGSTAGPFEAGRVASLCTYRTCQEAWRRASAMERRRGERRRVEGG